MRNTVFTSTYVQSSIYPQMTDKNPDTDQFEQLSQLQQTTVKNLGGSEFDNIYCMGVSVDENGNLYYGFGWGAADYNPKDPKTNAWYQIVQFDKTTQTATYVGKKGFKTALLELKNTYQKPLMLTLDSPGMNSWQDIEESEGGVDQVSRRTVLTFTALWEELGDCFDGLDLGNDDLGDIDQSEELTPKELDQREVELVSSFIKALYQIDPKMHVTLFPDEQKAIWIQVLKQIEQQYPGFIKRINLRCYEYGNQTDPGPWFTTIKKEIPQFANLKGFVTPCLFPTNSNLAGATYTPPHGKKIPYQTYTYHQMRLQFHSWMENPVNKEYLISGCMWTYEWMLAGIAKADPEKTLRSYRRAIIDGLK